MILYNSKIAIFFLLFFNFLVCGVDWENLTSTLNPTDIFIKNDNIYIGTNGGLLISNKLLENFTILDFKEDIYPLDISSLYIDSNDNILIGGNGPAASIQLLDNNYNHINTVFLDGIGSINKIIKIIEFNNNIYAVGRGSEFDLLIEFRFDYSEELYYQTVVSNLPAQNISTIYDIDVYTEDNLEKLFITTNKGVFVGTVIEGQVNWEIYIDNDLETSFFINGSILGSYFRDEKIIDVCPGYQPNEFNIITNRSLYNIIDSDSIRIFDSPYDLADFSSSFRLNELIVLGIENMGIYAFSINGNSVIDKNMYIPETILQNKFTGITVSESGSLIAISENGGSIISDSKIINFVPYNKKNNYPVNNYLDNNMKIIDFNQNRLFSGFSTNYRSGMQSPISIIESNWNSIYFTNSGITPDLNNLYNSPLVEIDLNTYACSNYGIGDNIIDGMNGIADIDSENSNYMVLSYLNKDRNGNLWILNPFSENYNNIVAIQTENESWHHIKDPYGLDSNTDNNLLIPTSFDFGPNEKVWFSFRKHSNQNDVIVSSGGIRILDYNNTIDDFSDDKWLEIQNSNILPGGPNVNIWSLAFSKNLDEDILWVLTSSGLKGYIVDDLELIEYPQTFYNNIYFDEFDKLKVDSQNNLWIITRHSGVRIISQDTTPWPDAKGFTTENSSILSNIVYDVAFNQYNGKIYFATEKGISILQSPFTDSPNQNLNQDILLSPNPFKLYNHELLSIWNLFPGSKVRIMTLNGSVLKTFQLNSNENKINSWNGILDNGKLISSGIYLVTASNSEYKSRIGKLAVIR